MNENRKRQKNEKERKKNVGIRKEGKNKNE